MKQMIIVLFHIPAMSLGYRRNAFMYFALQPSAEMKTMCYVLRKKKFIRCSKELVSHMNSLIASTGVDMTKTEETGTEAVVSDCGMKCR